MGVLIILVWYRYIGTVVWYSYVGAKWQQSFSGVKEYADWNNRIETPERELIAYGNLVLHNTTISN